MGREIDIRRMEEKLTKEFLNESVFRMDENTKRIANCIDRLEKVQIWKRPNEYSNSIGNLILHLCGNITQYVISSLGGVKDERERDLEFGIREGFSKAQLMAKLSATVESAINTINAMDPEQLMMKRMVQGFNYSGMANIIHVVEHYSYHTGQIAFWTKFLRNEDLGFYSGQDLNKRNEE